MRTSHVTARARVAADVRALVTGSGGFVGQWLCRELARQGWTVTGASLEGDPGTGVLSPEDHASVVWRREDLRDRRAIGLVLDAAAPEVIFHLAGISFVPAAAEDPMAALDLNVGVAVQILHEVRLRRAAGTLDPVVLVVGSAEQYGRHDAQSMPLREHSECRPRTAYAATKQAQEVFALEAFRSAGVRVVCTRSFNHSGRGQTTRFLLPALVNRVLAAKAAGDAEIPLGNTEPVRDFLHVEDAVRAYRLLAERGSSGEVYNVCSGNGVTVGDLAAEVLLAAGSGARLAPDPALKRAVDVPFLVGSNDKLRADTGWVPGRSRGDIISDLIRAASH